MLACLVGGTIALASCSAIGGRGMLHDVRDQFAEQYHACVPLGWIPERAADAYVPGYSAVTQDAGAWFQATWIAVIRDADLSDARARSVAAVLNALVTDGLIARSRHATLTRYHLTPRGARYYYDANHLGNDVEGWPYLCYSRKIPQRILSRTPAPITEGASARDTGEAMLVTFAWTVDEPAAWSTDPVARAHTVVLTPAASPVQALVVNRDGRWRIERLARSEPRIADAAAWPPAPR